MIAESRTFAIEPLLGVGVRSPISMKKVRSGTLLTVLKYPAWWRVGRGQGCQLPWLVCAARNHEAGNDVAQADFQQFFQQTPQIYAKLLDTY